MPVKKLIRNFFSMAVTGMLLLLFAFAIGYATILEGSYGTAAARALVYSARWFEVLLMVLALNLVGSMLVNRLASKGKWTVFLFHSAFLVILAGAAITRYTGMEGSVRLREGETTEHMLTESTYVSATAVFGRDSALFSKEVLFSPFSANRFKETLRIGEKEILIENLKFIRSAAETIVEDPGGGPVAALCTFDREGNRTDFVLRPDRPRRIGSKQFGFATPDDTSLIRLIPESGRLLLSSRDTLFLSGMMQGGQMKILPDSVVPFMERTIYHTGGQDFVLKRFFDRGRSEVAYVADHGGRVFPDAIRVRVVAGDESREAVIFGRKGEIGEPVEIDFGDLKLTISYGSVFHRFPFALKLNDFQIGRYPGSDSPSSFASEVSLTDHHLGIVKQYRIFMNNVLKYNGYRFFQASFDHDEKGTVLSVNYDLPGTAVSYAGYFLLFFGMFITLFNPVSRFRRLLTATSVLTAERKKLFGAAAIMGFLFVPLSGFSQAERFPVSPDHAREFGRLLVQSNEGRIEPVNTLASEVLRKVAKKGKFNGLDPVQVLLEMMAEPDEWKNAPLIRIGDAGLRKMVGADGDWISFGSLFSGGEAGRYKLREVVENAYEKRPAVRSRFDKEVINIDERANILYKFMNGGFLTIFPVPGDKNNRWASIPEIQQMAAPGLSEAATALFDDYLKALRKARFSGDYSDADKALQTLKENQATHGAAVYPSQLKTELEIFYINSSIFGKLAMAYVILGIGMLLFLFVSLFTQQKSPGFLIRTGFLVVLAAFVVHTAGLAIRWYISGHAPWSNGYETLLYISWATILAGLIFANRSPITLAVTAVLSSVSLFVAGMSWMNPELTNLVPVLKSYWLVIHVAVVTASYGFFGVAALLGMINLLLMVLAPFGENREKIRFTIKELALVIELAVIPGLFMLTAGAFLGGIWANESWGRYWGWDPKETWALVTILVYAFVTHMHRIPGFRGSFAMSLAAVTGFGSVLMTYFGVNYYLQGLHSYAGGEAVPVPAGIYAALFLVVLLALAAYFSEKYHSGKGEILPPTAA